MIILKSRKNIPCSKLNHVFYKRTFETIKRHHAILLNSTRKGRIVIILALQNSCKKGRMFKARRRLHVITKMINHPLKFEYEKQKK